MSRCGGTGLHLALSSTTAEVLEHPGRRSTSGCNRWLSTRLVKAGLHMSVASTPLVAQSSPGRSWVRRIVGGGQVVESCPAWCTVSHTADEVGNLDDLTHAGPVTEMFVETLDHWSDGRPVTLPVPVLRADIRVDPYSEDPRRSVPFASFEPFQDEVMDGLGPDELAAVVAQIRAHCDRLDGVVAQLRAVRVE